MSRRVHVVLFTLSLLACLIVRPAYGQISNVTNTTSTPIPGAGHDYIKLLSETVNPANGSVSVRVELPLPASRGLTLPFSIAYDSNGVRHLEAAYASRPQDVGTSVWVKDTGYLAQGGWSYSVPVLNLNQWQTDTPVIVSYGPPPQFHDYYCFYASGYVLRDASGGRHSLGMGAMTYPSADAPAGAGYCTGLPQSGGGDGQYFSSIPAYASEPGFYSALPATVWDRDGTTYTFPAAGAFLVPNARGDSWFVLPSSIVDRNGNKVVVSRNGSTTQYSMTDTAGRTSVSVNGFGPSGTTNTVLAGGVSYQVKWKTVTSSSYGVSAVWAGTGTGPSGGTTCTAPPATTAENQTVISEITLPNGQKYKFYYGSDNPDPSYNNPYGLLSEIDYPSGGSVRYTWKLSDTRNELSVYPGAYGSGSSVTPVPDACLYQYKTPVVASRSVSFGGSSVLAQGFTYNTAWDSSTPTHWTQKTTTMVSTDSVVGASVTTSYAYSWVFAPPEPFTHVTIPTQIPVEASITTPFRTVNKGWINQSLQKCEFQTLENNSNLVSGAFYTYDGNSQMTSKKEFEFGQVTAPATACNRDATLAGLPTPARETAITYQSFGTIPSGTSIVNKPSSTITYNYGTRRAETDLAYDEIGTDSVSVIAATHDDSNYPSGSGITRGNLTTQTQKCFAGAANCTDSVTKYTYDQTGQVTTMKDPCGNTTCADMLDPSHVTTYSYTDSYSSGTPPGNTNAYLTSITYPTTNGTTHTESFQYRYTDGQLSSSTDQNGRVTSYAYSDTLLRPTQVTYPDGGQTTIAYNDAPYNSTNNTPSVTTTKKIASVLNQVSTTAMDGIGHVVRTLLSSDPDGTTITDTTYDGFGRVRTQSNPHRANYASTDGITVFSYDALGRTTSVQKPDSGIVVTSYSGDSTTVTDEAGRQRRSRTDALGRLLEVDEPSASSPSTAGVGSISISGSLQGSGSPSHVTLTVTGAEGYVWVDRCQPPYSCPVQEWDSGTVTFTVNGYSTAVSYNQSLNTTSAQVAWSIAAGLNSPGSPVTATINGSVITLTSKIAGTSANYSFSTTYTSNSFGVTPANGRMTGGSGSVDTGYVSVTVGGFSTFVNYGLSSTASSVASALTTALGTPVAPVGGSPVYASLSGSTITVTSKTYGTASNFSLSTSSTSTGGFSPPSFSASPSGANLTGGADGLAGGGNLVTNYFYDGAGNLLCVLQKTTDTTPFSYSFNPATNTDNCLSAPVSWRPRKFTYDSLSRLLSANNPESGLINYAYDANGNVSSKTAPKPNQTGSLTVTTSYRYDALNRLRLKNYDDGSTATASYWYDGNGASGCTTMPPTLSDANAKPRRTAMCDASGATSWNHDSMGRTLSEVRTIIGNSALTNTIGYTYNFDGSMATLTYPNTGKVITYTPGGAGRPLAAQESGSGYYYAQSAHYAPFGALTGMTQGTAPISTTNGYNSRLQPSVLTTSTGANTILSLSYDFHLGAGDNGNVFQIVNGRDANRSQIFTYDSLNRIQQGNSSGSGSISWGETFTIDGWGNLTNRGGVAGKANTELLNAAPANWKNQLNGNCHDAAGNILLTTGVCPTGSFTPTYTYDAENRLLLTAGVTYTYDGDGNRVKKSNGPLYWGSGPLAESDLFGTIQKEYIFFNGKRVARRDVPGTPSVHFYFSDHLGSASVVTNATGTMSLCPVQNSPMNYTTIATGEEESDYYPYGGEMKLCDRAAQNYKFTGKERDTESGLDNFGARYDASSLGRFMTPDPIGIMKQKLRDPQQWNMYTYTRNNPLRFLDPTGQYTTCNMVVLSCAVEVGAFEAARLEAVRSKSIRERRAAKALGELGEKNGVTVKFDAGAGNWGKTQQDVRNHRAQNSVTVTMPSQAAGDKSLVVHEGTHVADFKQVMKNHHSMTRFQTEVTAFQAQSSTLNDNVAGFGSFWTLTDGNASLTVMAPVDSSADEVNLDSIKDFLANSPHYGLTEQNQGGPAFVPVP